MRKHIKEYIRDKNQQKVGVLIAVPIDDKLGIGFSKCNTKYDKVDLKRAEEIALIRAEKFSNVLPFKYNIPFLAVEKLPNFIDRCRRYYKDKSIPVWGKHFDPKKYVEEVNRRVLVKSKCK